jgi:hypothetical protein
MSGCNHNPDKEIEMKRMLATLALSAAVFAVIPPAPSLAAEENPATQPAGKQADVPVKAVVLFSSGVGYFEHYGTVTGNGSTELRFKTQQINDILKSLVLQDMEGGKVSTVTYPSQDPIAKTLKSFQVDITNNPPLADLLNQLRGAKITITKTDGGHLDGTVLGVEKKQRPSGGDKKETYEVSVLNIIKGAQIRSIPIDDLQDIQLDDAQLQDELSKALTALAQARDQDKKPVTINFRGEGERHVRIGYVVETPIWKTSYRLILPAGAQDKPKLQGWAIVENQTDNDWDGVQLSLVSGRPISFVQNLYQPLYIPRPVVQPELYASLNPQTYEGGMAAGKPTTPMMQAARRARQMDEAEKAPAAAAAAPPSDRLFGAAGMGGGGGGAPEQPMDVSSSIASVASAGKIGELFQYTVSQPVTLPRQKSAMIPIITDDVECEKLSIYNASVLPKNPLNGARIKNTTGKHLLQGPITVLEGNGYAGDARIDNVPPGQERLLSYGIDLQMTVDSTKNNQEERIQTGKIIKGVLQITRKYVATQNYIADNKSDHDKTLIVEHSIKQGWKLVDTDKPIETTDTLYRFKGIVTPDKTSTLTVKEETIQDQELAILPIDIDAVLMYSRTGEFPQKVRDALTKAAGMKQDVADLERQINEKNEKINTVTKDQSRTRENMKVVGQNNARGEYYKKLENTLADQDQQIVKLTDERDELTKKRDEARKTLEDYLSNLSVE